MTVMLRMRKKGFTLVELIVAIGLMGIIVVIASNLTVYAFKSHNVIKSKSHAQNEARLAALRIEKELRYSDDIVISDTDIIGMNSIELSAAELLIKGASTQVIASNIKAFTVLAEDGLIKLQITVAFGDTEYVLDTHIKPLNMVIPDQTGSKICYAPLTP